MYSNPDTIAPVVPMKSSRSPTGYARRGICRASKDLNVTRGHLRLVLTGQRKSEALMERIRECHPELLEGELRYPTNPQPHPTDKE